MPANTDPKKTYQYRWVNAFLMRLSEWQITDDNLVKKMVYAVVRYAMEHKLLRMGASILSMQKVLAICYEDILKERKALVEFASELSSSHSFVLHECGNPVNVARLTQKLKLGGYSNVIYWMKMNKISVSYAALSSDVMSALNAVAKSDPGQRSEVQSNTELLKRRVHILANSTLKRVAQRILGNIG